MSPKLPTNTSEGRTGRPSNYVDPDSWGGQLKAARIAKGFRSAQAFAEKLKVERPTVNRWESNKIVPPPHTIQLINRVLGTNFTSPKEDVKRSGKKAATKAPPKKSGKTRGARKSVPPPQPGLGDEESLQVKSLTPEQRKKYDRVLEQARRQLIEMGLIKEELGEGGQNE